MFDSVYFKCPSCGGTIEVQSKAGECCMHDFHPDHVPVNIANDINGERVWCRACGGNYTVVGVASRVSVPMRLM